MSPKSEASEIRTWYHDACQLSSQIQNASDNEGRPALAGRPPLSIRPAPVYFPLSKYSVMPEKAFRISIGMGNRIVEFFSAAISTRVER